MPSTTAAGSTIAISAVLPSSMDQAGYTALSFIEIGGVEKIGTIGATTAKIEFQPLKGPKEKLKGSTDYGSLTPSMAHDKSDAGQSLLRTAGEPDNNALYAYRVVYSNGDQRFFCGRVFGYPETVDGADTVLMANPTIEISSKIVKVDAGTVATAPAAPTIGTVTPGNAQISVAFTDNSNGGSTITGHKIERQTAGGSFSTIAANYTGSSPYVDTGLANGTAYGYRVSAINAVNTSVASGVASGTPVAPAQPTVTISGAQSKAEGNSGATLFTYTVTRSASAGAVSVPWSFTAGNTSANDFTGGTYPAGGNVTMADGVSSGTFSVSVNGDTTVEGDETFTVLISTPSGYVAGAATSATGTILNDDAGGGSPSFTAFTPQAETTAYSTALATPLTTRQMKTMNRFVQRIKGPIPGSSDGNVWAALKALPGAFLHVGRGPVEEQWLVNVLDPSRRLVKTGTPTFTPFSGITHAAATDYYETDVTLTAVSGTLPNMGVFTTAPGAVTNSIEMGAIDAGGSNGITIGVKGATTNRMGARALSASLGTAFDSNVNYWDRAGAHGLQVKANSASVSHHGKVIEEKARTPLTFTSTNKIRILGTSGATGTTGSTIGAAWLGGTLTPDQESWLAACIRTLFEDQWQGDIDLFEANEGPATVTVDNLVVGCTLQGVIAANTFKALLPSGTVALLGTEFETRTMHIGGMSRAGLTYVDSNLFSSLAISGKYRDVLSYINITVYAGSDTTSQDGLGVDPKTYGYAVRRMLDPTRTGNTYINGQDIPVYLSRGVKSISGSVGNYTVTATDGRVFKCKYIQGAEYDGSLLPLFPGMQTITGTEGFNTGDPNSGGQENFNGYKGTTAAYLDLPTNRSNGQTARISPYRTDGNASSGLLPLIEVPDPRAVNSPDPVSQPLNQRLSITNSLARYVPWPTTAPASFDPLVFEINYRLYAAQPTINLASISAIRNGRSPVFDLNNAGSGLVSTDLPQSGINYTNAATADGATSYSNRLAVRLAVMAHQKNYFWHVLGSTDSRIPAALKAAMAAYTMDATQYCDPDPSLGETLHYPPACGVYVRDPVYRMVRSQVLPYSGQDANLADSSPVRGGKVAGVAAYWVDRHQPRLVAHDDGQGMTVWSQGGYFVASGGNNLYSPVSYEHIVPDTTVTGGLIHPLAGNFTAVGWSQVRMEPALAHLSEFGAAAIVVAIEAGNIPVQSVDYATVKARVQGGQDNTILALPANA